MVAAISFGIGISLHDTLPEWIGYAAVIVGAGGMLAGWLVNSESVEGMRLLRMCSLALGFGGLGYWAMALHAEPGLYELVKRNPTAIEGWTGRVRQPGQLSASGREWTVVEATRVRIKERWVPVSGRVRVSRDTVKGLLFQTGDILSIQGSPKLVPEHDLLTGPPYNANLRRKGILLKAFIPASEAQRLAILENGAALHPYTLSARLARQVTDVLHRHLGNGQEAALAAALTVGDKQDIDGATRQAYATAGTLHILAVSGMHVGLLYELFLVAGMLLPLALQGHRRRTISLIVVTLLWGFAFMTGLQSSIVRAVVMFCVVEWGRLQGRQGRPMDMLALAALLMLAVDPYQLNDLGFRLSFAAMAGIFLLYRPMVALMSPKRAIPRYTWQAACLTLAAQAGTTPIALYHFHQFPTYFLPVNIPSVWLSALALYGCLAVLALSWRPWLANLVAVPVKWLLGATNGLMHYAAKLPYALVEDLYPGPAVCLLMTLSALLALLWVARPERRARLWLAAGTFASLGLLTAWTMAAKHDVNGIVLMPGRARPVAFAVRGGVLFRDQDSARMGAFLEEYGLEPAPGKAIKGYGEGLFRGVWQPREVRPLGEVASTRNLVLAGRQMFHLEEWLATVRPSCVIVSGHWRPKTRERYRSQAYAANCRILFLDTEGAVFLEDEVQ